MKQTTVNEFKDGLNLDLHPLVTPKTVLTDNINGTFITYNGNEFCLQNDRGNKYVTSLTPGYTPIGIKEHNGILYIVSVNGNKTEIGTFPSPEYENINLENAYKEEWKGSLNETYSPLYVLDGHNSLTNVDFGYSLETPVTIEIQDSYDGSVNLIIVADKHIPRIINSGFSVLPDNKYKFVNRKQNVVTNIYNDINKESELIRTSDVLTNINLLGVQAGGQFKGGNYTFYIKFGDGDFNQTDIVAESGIVSIFNGNDGIPSTISGTLLDERTDKMIHLAITGLNHVYSKIYIYYSREYSDTQGYRMTEYGMFNEPIDMLNDIESEDLIPIGSHIDSATGAVVTNTVRGQEIWLTGFEQTVPIEPEVLNIDYHTIDWARAEAQHSNMLFLGNIGQKETFQLYHELEEFTHNPFNVKSFIEQGSLVDTSSNNDSFSDKNYYSVKNIYNSLGYWPNEWYRFGIVYILDDGSTTPVFNMQGKIINGNEEILNDKGVFKTPNLDVLSTNRPINFRFELHNVEQLDSRVIGWFIVRQKRIPVTICQGINVGIDTRCYLPLIWDGNDWIIESFLSLDRSKVRGEPYGRKGRKIINASSLHILRPFIEIFDANTALFNKTKYVVPLTSLWNISGKKLSYDDYASWKNAAITTFNNSSSRDYDEEKDVIAEQSNISEYYTKGDENIHLIVYPILWIKDDDSDTYSESQDTKFLFYFYYGDISSQFVETDDVTFYLGNVEELTSIPDRNKYDYRYIKEPSNKISDRSSGIISLDPCVNSNISGMLDGSEFNICKEYDLTCISDENKLFNYTTPIKSENTTVVNSKCVFINENTKSKVISEDAIFSNLAGSSTDASQFERTQVTFGVKTAGNETSEKIYVKDDRVNEKYGLEDYRGYNSTHNLNLVRGMFTPYIGIDSNLSNNSVHLYSIKRNNNDNNERIVREQDNSEYYCVSNRQKVNRFNEDNTQVVYRGDCYICKVGLRVLKNFIDSTAPIGTTIVDPLGWETYVRQRSLYGGDNGDRANGGNDIDHKAEIADYSEVNLSDLNAVDLGYWVTFPCLSSYNLGLRSLDTFHVDEMALLGSPRSFYPLSGASAVNKVGDSYLLNDGLSATVGRKRYNLMPDVPYSKSEFANRIMFSNVHITDAFTNGYRTFQGMSYKDYDKQYGAITKLISLGQNIFVVMEHGLGLVPVNPKALMQTTTGEAIHIYGYGVLPNEMTIISQDYGSKYEHSVIRTPIGIYGVDVDAKKVWRFSDKQGFETISDMKVETYLKDYLNPVNIEMGLKDVRTHYNAKKGDIMFTFYTIDPNDRQAFNQKYFYINENDITVYLNKERIIKCSTNMKDSEINLTFSENLNCVYENKTIKVIGNEVGIGNVYVNGQLKAVINVSDSSEEHDPTYTVTLSRHEVALQSGQSYKLNATTNIDNPIFVWNSSDPSVVSVDPFGHIIGQVGIGTAVITVTVEGYDVFDSCTVNIQEEAIPVTGVSLNKSKVYVSPDMLFDLQATVNPDNATNKSVTWNVSGNILTTDTPNTFIAGSIGSGSITVTTEDGNYSDTANIVISDNVPVSKVNITPKTMTLYQGQKGQFTATVYPETATNKNVIWSVSQGDKASVDQTGCVTAISVGTSYVFAESEDKNAQGNSLITVLQNPPDRIVLSKNSVSVKVGETTSVASTLYCKIDNWISEILSNVYYEIENESIAEIVSSNNGEVFIQGVSRGVTRIIFTAKDDPSITASCEIIVTEGKLTLSTTYQNIFVNETKKVTIIEKEGDTNITKDNDNVSYQLQNNTIYLTGNSIGTTRFTISDGITTVELEAEVKEIIPLNDLIFNKEIPEAIRLRVGESFSIGYLCDPNNYTKEKYMNAFSVDNANIIKATATDRPQIILDSDLWENIDTLTTWTALRVGTTTGHIEICGRNQEFIKIKDYVLNFEVVDASTQDQYKVVMSDVSLTDVPTSIYADSVTQNDTIHLDCDVTLYKFVNGRYIESSDWGSKKFSIFYGYNRSFTISNVTTPTYHVSKDLELYNIVNQLYKRQLSVQTTIGSKTYRYTYTGNSNLVDTISNRLYIPIYYGSAGSDKLSVVPTSAGDIRFNEEVDLLTDEHSSKYYIRYNESNLLSNTINAIANENKRFYIAVPENYFGIDFRSIDIYDSSNNKLGRYIQPQSTDPMLLRSLSLKSNDKYITQDVLFFCYSEPQTINDTYTIKIELDN